MLVSEANSYSATVLNHHLNTMNLELDHIVTNIKKNPSNRQCNPVEQEARKDYCSIDNFTGYFDDANKPIFIGDKLKSKWNYEVIVVKDEDGDYSGKLVCDDNHSCKNIPYALNKGKGYSKIICT